MKSAMKHLILIASSKIVALAMFAVVLLVMATSPCNAFASAGDPIVVSLGDSYSSGEGNEPFIGQYYSGKTKNPDWLAHRSELSWPGSIQVEVDGSLKALRDLEGNWYFVASSGAITADIDQDGQWKYPCYGIDDTIEDEPTQLDKQIDIFDSERLAGKGVDYVTLTIGGNDLGFVSVLMQAAKESASDRASDYYLTTRCGLLGFLVKKNGYLDFNWTDNYIKHAWANFDGSGDDGVDIQSDIERVYRNILEAANKTRSNGDEAATLIVAGYPKLLTDEKNASALFDEKEVELVNQAAIDLDSRLSSLVKKLRDDDGLLIRYVSVLEEFDGHGAYSKKQRPFISPVIFGKQAEDIDLHFYTDYEKGNIRGNVKKLIESAKGLIFSSYSMHPNLSGIQVYADRVGEEIRSLEKEKRSSDTTKLEKSNDVSSSVKSRDITLVLDVSGSMAGDPMAATKNAASKFVNVALDNGAQTALVAYDDDAEVLSEFTTKEAYLKTAIEQLNDGGGTDMESGLTSAKSLLAKEHADSQYIVLMSDGQPNDGKTEDELVSYAESIRDPDGDGRDDVIIYTLGFNEDRDGEKLLRDIASEGCYFSVHDAGDLEDFFQDMVDSINGVKFMYARVACPVDVSVTLGGETLDSAGDNPKTRTSFGSLTFEENEGGISDDPVKVLRLREGQSYDVNIAGTGFGTMDYSIGFIDDEGIYSDFRTFSGIDITDRTAISTTAEAAETTTLAVDEDGDGTVDKTYRAGANQEGELVDNSWIMRAIVAGVAVVAFVAVGVLLHRAMRKRLVRIDSRQVRK